MLLSVTGIKKILEISSLYTKWRSGIAPDQEIQSKISSEWPCPPFHNLPKMQLVIPVMGVAQ